MSLSDIRRSAMRSASVLPITWIDSILQIGETVGDEPPLVKVEGLKMSHVMPAMVVEAGYRFSQRTPVVFAP